MKIIPTKYRNTLFRSRLEARWAVFFTELGLDWTYEPEGFDLNGIWYLPDFYVDGLGYMEVKFKGGDFSKAIEFAKATGEGIMLCEDVPQARTYILVEQAIPGEETKKADHYYQPNLGVRMISVTPCWDQAADEKRFFWDPGYENHDGTYPEEYHDYNPKYMAAVEKACSYNFNAK